jgi:hypothetical protein
MRESTFGYPSASPQYTPGRIEHHNSDEFPKATITLILPDASTLQYGGHMMRNAKKQEHTLAETVYKDFLGQVSNAAAEARAVHPILWPSIL